MTPQSFIRDRREGRIHSAEDVNAFVAGVASHEIPDYQISAWLMAACLKPLSLDETVSLTAAIANSGERLDLSALPKPWIDKHSTGGVGDKTTLIVLPLLAALGVTTVKMSGPGLGLTGGTIDKLASVPGFRTDLSPAEAIRQAATIGIALTGQTPALAPADKVLYALRDVTETVDSIPLIVSSVLSKKIAGGAETIVLDVKAGRGAFMPDLQAALELSQGLSDTGRRLGLNLKIIISDMNQPLGHAVGNALEVREALAMLREGPQGRLGELCLHLTNQALLAAGAKGDPEKAWSAGDAYRKAQEWLLAQGADPKVVEDPDQHLPRAPFAIEVLAPHAGYIESIDPRKIAQLVLSLGGGRHQVGDMIEPSVGIVSAIEVGDYVEEGQLIATIHSTREMPPAPVLNAVSIVENTVAPQPVVLETI